MSDLNVIGMILAILIATTFVSFYGTKCAHNRSDAMITGMVRGVSVTTKDRWLILAQEWLPMASGVAVFDLIVAVGLFEIGGSVVDPGIRLLAWMSAALAGFSSILWFIQGSMFFASWLSVLRHAESD